MIQLLHHPRKVHFELSLDGVGEVHDAQRGKKGVFKTVMKTISMLDSLRSRLRFSLNASQVIVDESGFDHYWELRNLLDPLNVDIFPVIAYEPSTALYSGTSMITVTDAMLTYDASFKQELNEFVNDLLAHLPNKHPSVTLAKQYYLNGVRNRIVHEINRLSPPCTALHHHLRINPDGEIPVCMHNSHTIGNLAYSPFKEIWMSNRAKSMRQWVDRCPGCWVGCEITPSAVYSMDILRVMLPWNRFL